MAFKKYIPLHLNAPLDLLIGYAYNIHLSYCTRILSNQESFSPEFEIFVLSHLQHFFHLHQVRSIVTRIRLISDDSFYGNPYDNFYDYFDDKFYDNFNDNFYGNPDDNS